jgi:DNA-binding transcriptional MerR regulator
VERGLIAPSVEAAGQGSKRSYDYSALLEFALCKELFGMGFGIQAVRKLLNDLRDDGNLRLWAENWDSYYEKIAEDFTRWYRTAHDDYPARPSFSDPNRPPGLFTKELADKIKPDRDVGVLFYCWRGEEVVREVVPLDLITAVEMVFPYRDIYQSSKLIIVDLGSLKSKIDHQILLSL